MSDEAHTFASGGLSAYTRMLGIAVGVAIALGIQRADHASNSECQSTAHASSRPVDR
jgi:hypothetical protein